MSKEINLVPIQKKSHDRKIHILFWVVAIISIIIVLSSSVLLFILNTQNSLQAIKSEEEVLSHNFSSMSNKIVKYVFISDRLKSASDIISKRTNFNSFIDLVRNQTPQDVNIESLTITKNTILINISSNSLSSIDLLLNNWLKLAEEKNIYKKITLGGIGVNEKASEFRTSIRINIL